MAPRAAILRGMAPLLLLTPLLFVALGVLALRLAEPRLIYKPPKLNTAELDALIAAAGATPLTLTTADGPIAAPA